MNSRWYNHSHPNLPQFTNYQDDPLAFNNCDHGEVNMKKKKKLHEPMEPIKTDRDLMCRQNELIYNSNGKSIGTRKRSKSRRSKSRSRHDKYDTGNFEQRPGQQEQTGQCCQCRCRCQSDPSMYNMPSLQSKQNSNAMPPIGLRPEYGEGTEALNSYMKDLSLNRQDKGHNDLINWVNSQLNSNYTKPEELNSGVAYCQLMNVLFPGSVSLKKLKFHTMYEHDSIQNLKVLQAAFQKARIEKVVPIDKLVRGRFGENLEFLQWFHKFFMTHFKGTPPGAGMGQHNSNQFHPPHPPHGPHMNPNGNHFLGREGPHDMTPRHHFPSMIPPMPMDMEGRGGPPMGGGYRNMRPQMNHQIGSQINSHCPMKSHQHPSGPGMPGGHRDCQMRDWLY